MFFFIILYIFVVISISHMFFYRPFRDTAVPGATVCTSKKKEYIVSWRLSYVGFSFELYMKREHSKKEGRGGWVQDTIMSNIDDHLSFSRRNIYYHSCEN